MHNKVVARKRIKPPAQIKTGNSNDAHPVLIYSAGSSSEYQIKMKNARSGGSRSLIMSAILEVD